MSQSDFFGTDDENQSNNTDPNLTYDDDETQDDIDATSIDDESSYEHDTKAINDTLERIRHNLTTDFSMQRLLFSVPGVEDPLTITGLTRITIGRTHGDFKPTVDLSQYHINIIGVSRHHATIRHIGGGWYIEDEGSRNGTWVDNRPLVAKRPYLLHSHHLIRIGNIPVTLTIQKKQYSYDETMDWVENYRDQFIVYDPELPQKLDYLPAHYMKFVLLPLIELIFDLMRVVDTSNQRPLQEYGIRSINSWGAKIWVQFSVQHEVINFLLHTTASIKGDKSLIDFDALTQQLINNHLPQTDEIAQASVAYNIKMILQQIFNNPLIMIDES